MSIPRIIYLCFAVFFIWNFKQQKEQKAFHESVYQQDLAVVEMIDGQIEEMWEKSARELQDYRKKEYRPILVAFRDIQTYFDELEQQIDSLEQIDQIDSMKKLFELTLQQSSSVYEGLLNEHGMIFGFRQEEIGLRLEHMQAYLEKHIPKNDVKDPSALNTFSYLKSKMKIVECRFS